MERLLESFISLFVIMDPIGNIPIFMSLAKGMPLIEIRKNINKSILVAGIILFAFLFFGLEIFDLFSINLDSFQIAGGIVVLIIGLLTVFGLMGKFFKAYGSDLSVPVGTPLLTGPGVITITVILVKENGPYVIALAAILTLASTWIILRNASKLHKILGNHWTAIISRVMGIILAAIAVEFITKGVLNIFGQYL